MSISRASERCHPGAAPSTPSTASILDDGRTTTPCDSWYRRLVVLTTWILNRSIPFLSNPAVTRIPTTVNEKAYRPASPREPARSASGTLPSRVCLYPWCREIHGVTTSRGENGERVGKGGEGGGNGKDKQESARTMGASVCAEKGWRWG